MGIVNSPFIVARSGRESRNLWVRAVWVPLHACNAGSAQISGGLSGPVTLAHQIPPRELVEWKPEAEKHRVA